MNKTFSVCLTGCSFVMQRLPTRYSLFIASCNSAYSTLSKSARVGVICTSVFTDSNRTPCLVTRASTVHPFPNYVKTICSMKESTENPGFDNSTSDCLDYSQFADLADNSDIEKKIKLIIMEHEISKQSGGRVPSNLTIDDMKELIQFNSVGGRTRYFNYLFKTEKSIQADKRKKEKRRLEYEQRKREREASDPGPKNTFFLRIRNPSMLKFYNSRQAHSVAFGSVFVFDMGYEEFMSKKESINCSSQISMAYGVNKIHRDPFNLYICNAKSDYKTVQYLANSIPHLHAANCLINVTEKSYLDLFPKDRIVYLTPNANEVLQHFDHDAIYVVGGFVDKSSPKPLSLAKAKRENLKIAKLPLDYYLHWGEGSKSLTLNQIMEIMLEVKHSNDWKEALKHVPTRKLHKVDVDAKRITTFNKKESALHRRLKVSSLFDNE